MVARSPVRPVHAVTGLFPEPALAEAAIASLAAAGFTADAVSLDAGCLRGWGEDSAILNLYVLALSRGHALLQVPAAPQDREKITRLFGQHRGHAVYYFTATGVESLSSAF